MIPVDDERYAAEFLAADRALADHGFEHYEVSNAARPGRRARHNSAYWRRAPFIGLGPSAHSGFGRTRQWNLRDWSAYERASDAGLSVVESTEQLSDEAIGLEEVYLGLRTSEGLASGLLPPEIDRRVDPGRLGAVRPWGSGSGSRRRDGCASTPWRPRLRRSPGHLGAGLGAPATDLGAGGHVGVLAHAVALIGATGTDGGACAAGVGMQLRAPDHEVGAGPADLRAVDQQPHDPLVELGAGFAGESAGRRSRGRCGGSWYSCSMHCSIVCVAPVVGLAMSSSRCLGYRGTSRALPGPRSHG